MNRIEQDSPGRDVDKIKIMKTALSMLIILLSAFASLAQNNRLNNHQIGDRISNCININYHPDSVSLKNTCRRACVFIKFNINKQGKVENLSFSKDSTAFVKEALTKAVTLLEKDKELINSLKKSGVTIVQPVMYDYQLNCNFPKDYSVNMPEEERLKKHMSYYKTRDIMEHYGETLYDMMNYEGKKIKSVACILLTPLWFGAGSME